MRSEDILVTCRGGPHGCETSRPLYCLENHLTDGDKVVGPTHRPRSTPKKNYFICFWYSRQCGILNTSQPYRPSGPLTGTAGLFVFFYRIFERVVMNARGRVVTLRCRRDGVNQHMQYVLSCLAA
jgi:hypothetical protein